MPQGKNLLSGPPPREVETEPQPPDEWQRQLLFILIRAIYAICGLNCSCRKRSKRRRQSKSGPEAAAPGKARKNYLASAAGKQDDSGVHHAIAANGNQDVSVAPALL